MGLKGMRTNVKGDVIGVGKRPSGKNRVKRKRLTAENLRLSNRGRAT